MKARGTGLIFQPTYKDGKLARSKPQPSGTSSTACAESESAKTQNLAIRPLPHVC